MAQPYHVAILPTPGMGHLIPLIEFAKRLVRLHTNFSATFIIPTTGPPSAAQKSVLQSLPTAITHLFLPPVSMDDVSPDAKIETIISLTVVRSLPSLHDALKNLIETTTPSAAKLVSLVVDLFGTDAFDVARELSISPFIFFPSTATALSLFLYLPELDKTVPCEYRELEEPVKIPGCVPIHGKDLLDPVQDRKNEAYRWLLHHAKRYILADGIMVNSFMELETGALKFLLQVKNPPVYPVGPLVKMEAAAESAAEEEECVKWLNKQPHGSVLFVSFGSGGTLSSGQIDELAFGLELSEQRFLWVVRSPNDRVANASYFNAESEKDPFDFLPKGFVDRTRGRGLVVPSWAPQARVLSHGSTGGFLTHCGWNSTLESVVSGVPLIVWPLFAEQKMNAVMLTEEIKVALRPEGGENGAVVIGREAIAGVVRGLMEGEEGKTVRNNVKDLKEAEGRVIGADGSSTKALAQVVKKWMEEEPKLERKFVG